MAYCSFVDMPNVIWILQIFLDKVLGGGTLKLGWGILICFTKIQGNGVFALEGEKDEKGFGGSFCGSDALCSCQL